MSIIPKIIWKSIKRFLKDHKDDNHEDLINILMHMIYSKQCKTM